MKQSKSRNVSALSQVELVIMMAVLAIISGIGVSTIGLGTISGSRAVKMDQDLGVLNSAVSAYLAFGGDLSKAETSGEVIAKLKSRVSEEHQRLMPGLSGNLLDLDVDFVMQTEEEAGLGKPRIRWNAVGARFELVQSGEPGIKELVKSPTGANGSPPGIEERKSGLKYASTGSWVWDYTDGVTPVPKGPSTFGTSNPTNTTTTAPPPLPGPGPKIIDPPKEPKKTLGSPVYSIQGGRYPGYDYNLDLNLTNPNPAGSSRLFYSVNYGAWAEYQSDSPLKVGPETSIKAQALPIDSTRWDDSAVVDEIYTAYATTLLPPTIGFSKNAFVTDKKVKEDKITVTLTNPNAAGSSEIKFQLIPVPGKDGPTTSFQPYVGPFVVSSSNYPDGFGVRAFAAASINGYEDSRTVSRFASSEKGLFGGHLDLDTSTTIAPVNSGSTEAHTHAITDKYGISGIDFFAIPDSKQIEITEAIESPLQKFKLMVVNANLSPGMSLIIDYEENGVSKTMDSTVAKYDDTKLAELPVYTLGGAPSTLKLKRLQVVMSQDVIHQASVIPTVTGDVRSNVPGKSNEWRNGALTVQAVAVRSDGSDAFYTNPSQSSGDHGAAKSGLIWEGALFWHWGGDSYDSDRNTYKPSDYNSVRLYIRDQDK